MKSAYIYLNEYSNGYLYVGLHAWNGPKGEIDPAYKGTSYVARRFGWVPVNQTILEVLEDASLYEREKFWIEKYAEEYGIADCARLLFHHCTEWISKYKMHGRLLNCHANDASQCHSEEAARKSFESRVRNGIVKEAVAHMHEVACLPESRIKAVATMQRNGTYVRMMPDLVKASHTPEACKRQVESRRRNGTLGMEAAHSSEAMKKAMETKRSNGSLEKSIKFLATQDIRNKAWNTRLQKARKVICEDGFVGCVSQLVEHLGISKGVAGNIVSMTHKQGSYTYKGKLYKIYKYEEN